LEPYQRVNITMVTWTMSIRIGDKTERTRERVNGENRPDQER